MRLLVLFAVMLSILAAPSAYAQSVDPRSTGSADLSPGWDISGPLDSESFVAWYDLSTPEMSGDTSPLIVRFGLYGAKPNHRYTVGAHFFAPYDHKKYPSRVFGGWLVGKSTSTREGNTAATEAWDLGYIQTDANGNADVENTYNVRDGIYNVQFTVREGDGCRPNEGQFNGCSVVYRTGKRFADGIQEVQAGGYKTHHHDIDPLEG